jgi:hypothetical protein
VWPTFQFLQFRPPSLNYLNRARVVPVGDGDEHQAPETPTVPVVGPEPHQAKVVPVDNCGVYAPPPEPKRCIIIPVNRVAPDAGDKEKKAVNFEVLQKLEDSNSNSSSSWAPQQMDFASKVGALIGSKYHLLSGTSAKEAVIRANDSSLSGFQTEPNSDTNRILNNGLAGAVADADPNSDGNRMFVHVQARLSSPDESNLKMGSGSDKPVAPLG